ncbi:ABC transporter permease [Parabacteroides sp. ZJ-118]|uniref:ABC transporter permease n=1 Tax=Parabacteroides sp. ZJ-118 TaxID=2709398 RepID=UPI0013E9CA44|nr:ABC transporter permease [Parabacteroides sp. ZJ-118]
MKTILRNLLSVLRRFKMAALLNVLGLSIAFAAFILIMMQVDYDRNFDRGYTDTESIFRVEAMFEDGGQTLICRPLADAFIQSSPHIVAGTLVDLWKGDLFFSVEENGVRNTFKEQCINVYPEFTKVFDFQFQEGNPDALQEPNVVLLPRSMARKLFGNQSAVGKRLMFENGDHLTVGGVYKDYPRNSSVRNCIYRKMNPKENFQSWGNWNYFFYIRLDDPKNAEGLFENFKAHFDPALLKDNSFSWRETEMTFRFNPLPDVHYTTDVKYDLPPKASMQTLMILFAIAIVIVIIAGINFTNFSTALAPMRMKSINAQKVLGGEESAIRFALALEAVFISIVSYLLGLLFVHIAGKTEIASLINADISLSMHMGLILVAALISIATGLLAGIYPAYYMTSFPPALVLKGSFGLSPRGRQLRNVLIGVQYVASFGLIIGATFMYLQNYYMQNTPLGYDKEAVIVTDMNGKIRKSIDAFASQVKSFSGIEEITYAEKLLSSQDQYMGWGRDYRDKNIQFQCLPVDPSFLKVMNVKISEGRNFREEDKAKRHGALIFNERARAEYELELGALVDSMEIIGFMPDVKFASFRTEVTPMAFFVWGTDNWGTQPDYAYIKVKAGSDLQEAMRHVKTTLQSFDPEYPFNVRFFDEVLNGLYEKERSLSSLITLFSLIAIFISVVGVFGLVVFDSEYRKKEIGVRKVLGSTTGEIIVMFNKTYIRVLCICFGLGAPVAGYAVSRWLENFAYKTPMYWWVYLIAFAIITVITVLTVTFQNWHAANANPVDSIKTE